MRRKYIIIKCQILKLFPFDLNKEFYYLNHLFVLIFTYPVDERCLHKYLKFLYTSKNTCCLQRASGSEMDDAPLNTV